MTIAEKEITVEIYRGIADLEAAVGKELGPSEWFAIEQDRVDGFADVTEDHQWIHVDTEKAAGGPFGATIAHGFLSLSLVPYFVSRLRRIEGAVMGVNYGLDRVRFPSPVRVGSRIRGRTVVRTADRIDENSIQLVMRTTLEVEGSEKPGCVADLVSRHYF
jgi:acyl dehydratase